MSTQQIIEHELVHLHKKLQTCLARGLWAKAHECSIERDCLLRLKERIVDEQTPPLRTIPLPTAIVPP